MKRISALLCAIFLVSALCVSAYAAGSAELVRAFVYDGTLYTYVDITENDRPITKADAKIGTQIFPATHKLETVRQAGSPITYLILVDNSNSMPEFQADVTAFAQVLAESSGANARFTLATFGRDFQVVAENMSADVFAEQIGTLSYAETITRLHSGIAGALDYFEGIPRQGNELRSMIVLTDAVQYDPQGGVPYEELLERVEQSDVMLHAVGFGNDTASLASMETLIRASGGFQWVIGPESSAANAADELTAYTDRLFVTGFDLTGCSADGTQRVSVTFASGSELVCRAEMDVELPAAEVPDPEETPEKPVTPMPPANEGSTQPAAPSRNAENTNDDGPNLLIVGTPIAVVLVIVAVVVLLTKRKKTTPAATSTHAGVASEESGIFMRLEVLQGELTSQKTELTLVKELFVGRDSGCDIVFNDTLLAPHHCRISLMDGAIRIEDLHSASGTAVNGEAIHDTQRLRSGDKITIGNSDFRLKF